MDIIHLAPWDVAIILFYLIGVVLLGLWISHTHETSDDYFLASRSMPWYLIGISLFASNISSTTLVGLSGFAYGHNISVFNYEWMAALVLVIFSWFFLPYYIKTQIYTVPEFFEKRFDARIRYLFSAMTLFLNIVVDTAGSLFAGGLVLNLIFPELSLSFIISGLAVVAGLYTITGGLKAVIYTDAVQTILLLIGSIVITVIATDKIGGWHNFLAHVPAADMKLIRPYDDANMPWPGLISGVLIIGFYFWGMNQFIVQRMLSARDLNHARWGAMFAGLLKLPVLFIMVMPGMMARYIFPEIDNQDQVYPTLLFELLPAGLLGLVIAGLIAALMSSIDSTLNSASTLVTMDFVHKIKPGLSSEQLMWCGRIVTFVFMFLAVLWAPQIDRFPSLFNYLQQILSYAVSPVVGVLILGIFWRGVTSSAAFYSLLISFFVGAVIFILNTVLNIITIHFLYIAPLLLLINMLCGLLLSLLYPKPLTAEQGALHWDIKTFRREDSELKRLPWYLNYRYQSLVLLGMTLVLVTSFW